MTCKACTSENLQKLDGEFTASFPDSEQVRTPPVYVAQSMLVCLDCGFAELMIPGRELELLKKAKTIRRS